MSWNAGLDEISNQLAQFVAMQDVTPEAAKVVCNDLEKIATKLKSLFASLGEQERTPGVMIYINMMLKQMTILKENFSKIAGPSAYTTLKAIEKMMNS